MLHRIQDIVMVQAFTEAQKSSLLAAFYPGYIIAMLPAGYAVQKWGPKLLLGLDNYLQGAALLCVPMAAKMGVLPLCICMNAMGVAQAPIFPGQSVMKRDFQGRLPAALRPWAIQFMRLSAAAGEIFSKATTPIISVRWGWQAVCYAYGGVSLGFAVLWGLLARSKPPEPTNVQQQVRGATTPAQQAMGSPKKAVVKDVSMDESVLEYGVLKVPAAIACMLAHASCNNLGYTLTQWAPTYYASVLGCDAIETGKHLAVTGVVRFIGNFMGATLETVLQRMGFRQINIRKGVCLVNNTIQAGCCLGFGMSQSPLMATIFNCGACLCDCFQGIGFSQNYYEVGGPDTAILTSVGNVFASLGGMVAPMLGTYLLARTGQWYPLYAISAGIHVFAGFFFAIFASDTPARQLLYGKSGGGGDIAEEMTKLFMSSRPVQHRTQR